jgi:hypothetical protein
MEQYSLKRTSSFGLENADYIPQSLGIYPAMESTPKRSRNRLSLGGSSLTTEKSDSGIFGTLRKKMKRDSRSSIVSGSFSINDFDLNNSNCSSRSSKFSKSHLSRRLSLVEKFEKTKSKIKAKCLKSKKMNKIGDKGIEHPNRVFSTRLILANNQRFVDDIVIWEEKFTMPN